MVVLNPGRVVFGAETWEGVTSVVIDRVAVKEVVEFTDFGAHAGFVDVAEQEVRVRVEQRLEQAEGVLAGPVPGAGGSLVFHASATGSDTGRVRVRIAGVVTGVTHAIGKGGRATRTIELLGVSSDGEADPVVIESGEDGKA